MGYCCFWGRLSPEITSHTETFAEYSILFKFKEGEDFNHRNILDISRIKI